MDASLVPVSEIIKLLREVKKVMRDFPLLFESLASTLERIVPVITDIEKMEKRSNPNSKALDFLTETTRRAQEVVRECSRIGGYNVPKRKRYIEEIEGINQKFLMFCQVELALLAYRNSLSRRSLEETTRLSIGRSSFDENQQRIILESFEANMKNKNKQRVILESNKDEDEDDQWAILEGIKANEKGKQVQADEHFALCLDMEQLHVHQKIDSPFQEFNFLSHQQRAERLTNGSTSSAITLANEDEQRAILESLKKNEA